MPLVIALGGALAARLDRHLAPIWGRKCHGGHRL